MSEGRSSHDPVDKTWIEKIAQAFSSEPKTRDDLLDVIKVAEQNDVIDKDVTQILDGALSVAEMQVREIMVPRAQMTVIKASQPLSESLPVIIRSAHSRYPVVGENTDDILGILLTKDLLPQILQSDAEHFDIKPLLRPATIIPEAKRLNVLLREFRETRNHMALVIDEYGGVSGLVTIEDVLEQIVGEIEDEHDITADNHIKRLSDSDYIVKALTPIEDFNEFFNSHINDDEFDTIGGILLQQFGHMPRRNEVARINGFEFKVINADTRRIHLLRMTKLDGEEH